MMKRYVVVYLSTKKKNANRFVDFSEAQIWRSPHSLDEEVHHTLNKGYTWQPWPMKGKDNDQIIWSAVFQKAVFFL